MIFGLTWEKLLLIGFLAAILIGPERLPRIAETAARLVHRGGDYLRGAKTRMKEELGPEIDDLDWRKLDPRQYDPRRIIRDALFEEPGASAAGAVAVAGSIAGAVSEDRMPERPSPRGPQTFSAETPPPFDNEAT